MSELDKVKRGMPRGLLYVLIPLGFVILGFLMFASGDNEPIPQDDLVTDEATDDVEVEE